jgi:hypothetical protein
MRTAHNQYIINATDVEVSGSTLLGDFIEISLKYNAEMPPKVNIHNILVH